MAEDFNAALAGRIAAARKRAGKTQQQIANALAFHVNHYQRLETGKHRVSAYDLSRIATAIGVPALNLLAPEFVCVPVNPPDALLRSMAIRYDHGLAVPGYYDQPIFGAENVGHARRMESTLTTMRQLYEEVVGKGFYRPEAK